MSTIVYWICTPFAWLVRLFYNLTGSYGVSLILFTLVIKLILLPFQMKSKKSMVRMNRMSGKMQEIQKKYANNRVKMNEEMQKFYEEEGVNPMSGCLWSFLPLPILMALYYIIREPIVYFMNFGGRAAGLEVVEAARQVIENAGITLSSNAAYEQINVAQFVTNHWDQFQGKFDGLMNIDFSFLGLDLTAWPWDMVKNFTFTWACIGVIAIPIVSGLLSFLLSKVTSTSNGQKDQPGMKGMLIMMPLMSVYIGFILPTALGIYWIANSVFAMIQEAILGKFYTKKITAEEEERAAKRDAARQLRMEEAKKRAAELKELEGKKPKKQPQKSPEKRVSTNEAGRVGDRPYARGRSYKEDRYDTKE